MKWFPPWGWSWTTRDDVLTGVSCYDATMNTILQTYNELWDKVWWNRHQAWREKIESGEVELTESRREVFAGDCETATRIGRNNLGRDDLGRPSGERAVGSQLRREGGE
jgi:hypothetical protein